LRIVQSISTQSKVTTTQYPTRASQARLIEILLSKAALSWFAPLLEKKSSPLKNLDGFFV
jgi:hypothetical protein